MPLIPIALGFLLLFALFLLTIPLTLVQRYRMGKARRLGRPWVAMLNLVTLIFSIPFFLWATAITNLWVPGALRYALLGLAGGALLGLFGLIMTRWEAAPRSLHYTPNRWLILAITMAVAARLVYGFWRSWHAWRAAGPDHSWLASSGVAGSLAVGAVVLGYYLIYSVGLCWRLRRH